MRDAYSGSGRNGFAPGIAGVVIALLMSGSTGAQTADPPTAPQPGLGMVWSESTPGVLTLADVTKGSAAAAAGLKPGDVIVSVNDASATSDAELTKLLGQVQAGETVTLGVRREDKTAKVPLIMPGTVATAAPARVGLLGAFVKTDSKGRMTIEEVTIGSPAADAGLKVGDVIQTVEGRALKTVDGLVDLTGDFIRTRGPGDKIDVTVMRAGNEAAVAIVLPDRPAPLVDTDTAPETPGRAMLKPAMILGVVVDERPGRVTVHEVMEGGPADNAEIMPGDEIRAIGTMKILSFADLAAAVNGFKPAEHADVRILRAGRSMVMTTRAMVNEKAMPDVMMTRTGSLAESSDMSDMEQLRQEVRELREMVEALAAEVELLRRGR